MIPHSWGLLNTLLRCLQRPTPLESSVLQAVAAALPQEEGETFRAQFKAASFKREWGGRCVHFFFNGQTPPPPITRLSGFVKAPLATVTVQGKASLFKTTAKVHVMRGILSSLDFDLIPWSEKEDYTLECQIFGTPELPDSPRPAEQVRCPSERHRS